VASDETRRSLRFELLATLTMVLVLAVVALSFAAEVLGQRRHQGLEVERMREHTAGLATLTAMRFAGGAADREAIETLLQQERGSSRSTLAAEVFILNEGGSPELLASSGMPRMGAPRPSGESQVIDRKIDGEGVIIIDESVPTFSTAGRRAVLRLTVQQGTWTQSADWQAILFVALGVALVLSFLGAMLLELQVLKPLRALEEGVARVKGGEFGVQLETQGPAELHRVSAGFNEMTEALDQQRGALRDQGAQLRRQEHLADVGRLAAGVAHEVGNPLAALLGYVEFLIDPRAKPPLSEEQRGLLERIRNQTVRIQDIVGQLLDYSRERQLEPKQIRVGEFATELASMLRANSGRQELEVEVVGEKDAILWADPRLLTQIVLHLGMTATTAAIAEHENDEQAPKVQLALRRSGDSRVAFEVRDNGPGVPEELHERIFEPFFTTRAAGEGTGLGLAISAGLAEVMGAQLRCETERSLLGGACFVLELPVGHPPNAETSLVEEVSRLR
jgi:signal transduction histidine kinase